MCTLWGYNQPTKQFMTKSDIIVILVFLALLLLANETGVIDHIYPFSYLFVFGAYLLGKYIAKKEADKKALQNS